MERPWWWLRLAPAALFCAWRSRVWIVTLEPCDRHGATGAAWWSPGRWPRITCAWAAHGRRMFHVEHSATSCSTACSRRARQGTHRKLQGGSTPGARCRARCSTKQKSPLRGSYSTPARRRARARTRLRARTQPLSLIFLDHFSRFLPPRPALLLPMLHLRRPTLSPLEASPWNRLFR